MVENEEVSTTTNTIVAKTLKMTKTNSRRSGEATEVGVVGAVAVEDTKIMTNKNRTRLTLHK